MDRVRLGVVGVGNIAPLNVSGYHYPPLVEAKRLIADGAVGTPTMLRIRTVVGDTDSPFQAALDPAGYEWRFDNRSPGGTCVTASRATSDAVVCRSPRVSSPTQTTSSAARVLAPATSDPDRPRGQVT